MHHHVTSPYLGFFSLSESRAAFWSFSVFAPLDGDAGKEDALCINTLYLVTTTTTTIITIIIIKLIIITATTTTIIIIIIEIIIIIIIITTTNPDLKINWIQVWT